MDKEYTNYEDYKKDKENKKRQDELPKVITTVILAVIAVKVLQQTKAKHPIINNFYIIEDKIIPFRFR